MGGAQGKAKGRGDGPELLYDSSTYLAKSGGRHNVGDMCSTSSIQMWSLRRSRVWDKLVVDSTMSTPDFSSNNNNQHPVDATLKKQRTCRLQKVQQQQRKRREQISVCTKTAPEETKGNVKENKKEEEKEIILSSNFVVPPPKIRLQILSPVHSRHRGGGRIQEDSMEIPCSSSSDLKPANSCEEDDAKILKTEEVKNLVNCLRSSSSAQDTKNLSLSSVYSCPNELVSGIYRSPKLTPERIQGGRCMNQMMMMKSPPHIIPKQTTKFPNPDENHGGNSSSSNKVINIINTAPPPIIPHSLATDREMMNSVNEAAKRKLKVKGLKNFIDSHRRPCPPLWAKEFPCRSKFHPDNYLYDFEGLNAPKRPTRMMEKCPKKCGRCNRCGVYVDSICSKCHRCAQDCRCSAKTTSATNNNTNVPLAPPLPFAPTAEHFVSQLFGPNWSQTQKIQVNDVPIEPDRPKRNLHDCSSNNPLKIKNSTPVLATGYDSYAPVPNQQQSLPFGYQSYHPGGWYPSYPAPYPPMPYYPSYMPVPSPAPFYGYPPPLSNPNYSTYQASVSK